MMGLHALIDSELNKRGWKASDLAANSDVSEATLSRIKNNPGYKPDLPTLAAISIGLDVPLRRVVEACGYSIDAGAENEDDNERIMALLRAVPDLQVFLRPLARLRLEDRQAILAVAEQMANQRGDVE